MKTRLVVLAALALGALAGAGGCADNRASIQVQAICALPDDCGLLEGGCEAEWGGPVIVDVSKTDALTLILQVENQLPDNGDPSSWRANTNDGHLDELIIEYDLPVGALAPREPGANGYLPANSKTAVAVTIPVPATTPVGEIVARVRMRGYLDDDTRFETGEFPISIEVCAGCVESCGAGVATCPPFSDGQAPLLCMVEEPAAKPAN